MTIEKERVDETQGEDEVSCFFCWLNMVFEKNEVAM